MCLSGIVFGGGKDTKPALYVHCLYFLGLVGMRWRHKPMTNYAPKSTVIVNVSNFHSLSSLLGM